MHSLLKKVILLVLWLAFAGSVSARDWYVAPDGSDDDSGRENSPFATIMKAHEEASAGDTVCLRGGTYVLDNSNITVTDRGYAVVNNITKNGISYVACEGERPVFDFSGVKPDGLRVTALLVTADECVFEGFDVIGVQVTIAKGTEGIRNTQSECFRVSGGSGNRFENLAMHDGMGIGWYLTDGSDNLVINCDAYNNKGLDSMSDENADGFGCHPRSEKGTGNRFEGCRAWYNADDGFDLIKANAAVTITDCGAFWNGYDYESPKEGLKNGNGFKAGGYGLSGDDFPRKVPVHAVIQCLAVGNRAAGFYANHHPGRIDWINNTAIDNKRNFDMLCSRDNTKANDGPGFDQFMRNNLSFHEEKSRDIVNLGPADENDAAFNSWDLDIKVGKRDFESLKEELLTMPRQPDGSLPETDYTRLTSRSDLIDAGCDTGLSFNGKAPDLGAFEYDSGR